MQMNIKSGLGKYAKNIQLADEICISTKSEINVIAVIYLLVASLR